MLALVITASFMFIVNYLQNLLSKGIPLKLTEIFVILTEKTFRRDISRQDWSYNSDDPNVLWADWKAKFLTIVNSHAPIKTKRVRSRKVPWVTSHLRNGMRDRDVAKRKAIKSNDPQDWAVYSLPRSRFLGCHATLHPKEASFGWSVA